MTTVLWVLGMGVILLWDLGWWLMGVKPILPGTLKRVLRKNHPPLLLLDVRTRFEYERFHIQEATLQPTLLVNPEVLPKTDLEVPIVIVCMSGHRSAVAAYRLRKLGFRKVSYLAGGMLAWLLSGGPTIRRSRRE